MKILVLSNSFLPSTISNAKRPYYITKTFLDAGHEVDVISSFRGMSIGQPEMLHHEKLQIKRIDDPQEAICRKFSGKAQQVVHRGLKAVLWPDEFVLWSLRILRQVKTGKYDRIMVCLRPESLLLGSLIKKVSDKWVFDCQEAFVPDRVKLRRSPVPRMLLSLFMWMQRRVLHKAGKVVFTSEESRKEYERIGLVEGKKTRTLPLFFDDTFCVNREPLKEREKFIIEYAGQFNRLWGRSPEIFLRSLHLFLSETPRARASVAFSFHGPWIEDHTQLVRDLGLEDVVRINPPVSYEKYLAVLSSATVLLFCASKDDNLFIPGKMIDYFSVGSPILAFVPSDSETFQILKQAGMDEYASDENDAVGGSINIKKLWEKWDKQKPFRGSHLVEKWSWTYQKTNILDLLRMDADL